MGPLAVLVVVLLALVVLDLLALRFGRDSRPGIESPPAGFVGSSR